MDKGILFDAVISEEIHEGRKIYNVTCEELGITDFGDTPEEAIENLKNGLDFLFEVEPSKKEFLMSFSKVWTIENLKR